VFELFLSTHANKFLDKCKDEERIMTRLLQLELRPFPKQMKKIVGNDLFRIRIGNYRALYSVDKEKKQIVVHQIDKRSRIY
jgi:mRNA interferase RelE/StbE